MTSLYNRPGVLLAFTSLFWAGNFVLARGFVTVIPPVALAALRWLLACLFILPFALHYVRRDWQTVRRHWRILLFFGLIGPGCFNTLTYLGLVSTEALNGLVLNSAGPMFIALTAWAIFGDRISTWQISGMAAAFFGVIVIIAKGNLASLANFQFNPGDLLLLVALMTWAIYTAYLRKKPPLSWQTFSVITYGIAGLGNIPFVIVEYADGARLHLTWQTAAVIVYTATLPSLVAYIFYNRGVELIGPARAAIYLFLIPIFGALLATGFLGEHLYLFHAVGFALILAGVVLGLRKPKFDLSAPDHPISVPK